MLKNIFNVFQRMHMIFFSYLMKQFMHQVQIKLSLQISTAPDIYTFKLYDWCRLGLDGRPCLLNIEHGMKNLKFDRHAKELRCQAISLRMEENKYEEQHLPTHRITLL